MNVSPDKIMQAAKRTTEVAPPLLIAWEVTRRCNLNCRHCRAAAENRAYAGELSTAQCRTLLDNIASFGKPIIILTGGEPMLRDDIYEIARHGHELGLRMVMAPCGMLVNDESVERLKAAGIQAISISLDGATAEAHDGFRQVEGAFAAAINACDVARRHGLPFQINTTVTRHNRATLGQIMALAEQLGAATFNPFLLVPTGRGKELAGQEISAAQYEEVLQWLSRQRGKTKMQLRVTCAPHYQRIIRQQAAAAGDAPTGLGGGPRGHDGPGRPGGHGHGGDAPRPAGCMGGKSFAFISHTGVVSICGFLETPAGDVSRNGLDFKDIWLHSDFFRRIRDVDHYHGKCGYCEYRRLCGGCRARVAALSEDAFGSEPFCVYQPKRKSPS